MNHIDLILYWLTLGFEAMLCLRVYTWSVHLRLPLFAAYSTTLLASGTLTGLIAFHFGYQSATYYYAVWTIIGVNLLARCLAIAELCCSTLQAYRGIRALVWRVLVVLALLFLANGVIDAWGQPDRIHIYGLTIERDFGMASIVILLAILFIRNYYSLSLEPLQRWIALGMCILCVADVVNNTALRYAFTGSLSFWFYTKYMPFWPDVRPQIERANDLWNGIRTAAFIVSLSLWCFALRKPLPAQKQVPELLAAEVYRELSPALNMRLRTFNDRLLELLKP